MPPELHSDRTESESAIPKRESAAATSVRSGYSIRRNVVYAVLGNGVLNLSRLAVLALLAKHASTEIQGIYTYTTIALASPVILFCSFELRSAFVSDTRGEFSFGTYRALRGLGMLVAGLVLVGVVFWQSNGRFDPLLIWMMLAICAGKLAFTQAEVYWGVYQRRERLGLMAVSNALRGVTMLLSFVVLFRWLPGLGLIELSQSDSTQRMRLPAWAISIYVLVWMLICRCFDRRMAFAQGDVDPHWQWSGLWKLAKQTFPLGLVFLLINLCDTVTQWSIKHTAGDAEWKELGYFGAMRFITLVAMFSGRTSESCRRESLSPSLP